MRKSCLFAFVFMLGIFGRSWAEPDYLWPMKLTPELTSKFCDYRAGHFHGGLDLRTQGRTGIPVYAVSNAYVFRVTTSFRGYGKALYLKLPDGRLVVYGHLSGFTPEIEERVYNAQIKSQKYNQDLYFTSSELPVKRGELVAYSGSTGIGAPHLHFEMRSPSNNPINPLESGFALTDKLAPRFDELVIRYYDGSYTGQFNPANPCVIEFKPVIRSSRPNEYILKDTLVTDQYLALAVSGGDLIGGPGFLYGFFGLKLFMDSTLIFQMESDSLSFNTTRQLTYIRDLELIRLTSGRKKTDNDKNIFYRLYVPPNAQQFFWCGFNSCDGVIAPSPVAGSVRKVEIVAYDESGNQSRLRMYVKTPDIRLPDAGAIRYGRKGDSLEIEFASHQKPATAILEYRQAPTELFKRAKSRFVSLKDLAADSLFSNRLGSVISPAPREYRFSFRDNAGHVSPWIYFSESTSRDMLRLDGSPNYLKVSYSTNGLKAPVLSLLIKNHRENITMPLHQSGPGLYSAALNDRQLSGLCRFAISDGSMTLADTQIVLYAVSPESTCEVDSPDSTMTIYFQSNSSYYPDYIFPSAGKLTHEARGNAIVYDIQPANFLADQLLKFKFNVARLGLAGRKIGAYGASAGGGWNFIGKIDGSKWEVAGLGLGKIALIEDSDPPVISSVSPSATTSSGTPLLSCHLDDNLSGLALDTGLSMTIDGIWAPAEYDIDSGKFSYKVRKALKPGKHQLEISAADNQGNIAGKIISFTVIEKK